MPALPTKEEAINEAQKNKMTDEMIIVHNKKEQTEFEIQ